MRVHPLTHLDRREDGSEILLVHVELRDRFGDAVKGVGALRVEVTRGSGVSSGPSAVWEVSDLADPERSSRRFDPSTRTYRLPLEAPGWLAGALREARPKTGTAGRPRVRVTFTATGKSGVLADELVLEP
jgi:hypothetical protein